MCKSNSTSGLEKGQSLIEFAVGVTFMIFLLAGIIDFSRAFFTYMTLRDAAQEGALYGTMHPTNNAGIRSRVQDISDGPIDMSQVVVDTYSEAGACAGKQIQVTVTYQFPISMPLIGAIVGSQSFPLRATAIDYIVSPPC